MINRYSILPLLLVSACADAKREPSSDAPAETEWEAVPGGRQQILFVGTSLTAGLGLDPSLAYPALIQRKLDEAGLEYETYNAGVSGETSAGARERIGWLMERRRPAVLVIETGANDGLRGLDVAAMRANLEAMVDRAQRQDPAPDILIVGMEASPTLGRDYTSAFRAVFREVAEAKGAVYVPFILEGVAGVDSLNQGDGIHPTASGQRIMAEIMWQALEPVLRRRQQVVLGRFGGHPERAQASRGIYSESPVTDQ